MRWIATLGCLLVLVLAGCTSPAKDSSPTSSDPGPPTTRPPDFPPSINETVDLFQLVPELVNCDYLTVEMEVPREDVAPLLPPGYEPTGPGTPVTTSIFMEVDACESILLTNETVIRPFTLLQVLVRVATNDTLQGEADATYYALELYASNASVTAFMLAMGFEVRTAEIPLEQGTTSVDLSVSVEGQVLYEVSAMEGVLDFAPERTFADRSLQFVANQTHLWFDHERTYTLPNYPGEASVTTHGGALQQFSVPGTNQLFGASQFGPARGSLRFDKFP